MRRVPVPSPSTNRPPDSSSRSSAVTAVSSGERPNAHAMPVPSSMRSVSSAAAASASGPEWLWNSGAQAESKPASSALRASVTFSRCVGSSSRSPSGVSMFSLGCGCVGAPTLKNVPGWAVEMLRERRVAHLGLTDDDGLPRVLPVTFALYADSLWTAIDTKPKRAAEPARVRWLRARPAAALTVDRYDDDWDLLAWVQVLCRAQVL